MAPPGRQKSEREFCLFGGVFCVRCAAPPAGAAVFAKLAAVVVAFAPGFLIHSAAVSFSAGAVCAGNLIPLFGLPRRGCRGVPQSRRLCPGPRVASAFVPGPRAACLFCVWPALPGLFAENALCAFLHAFFSYHFALSCLTFFSQTSFHLSLRPRREFPCLSPPVALFPARGSCHLLLFCELLRPLPVFPFCIVRAGFLPCF